MKGSYDSRNSKIFGVSFEVYGIVFIDLVEVEEFSNDAFDRFRLGFGSM